jgi:DNA repair protein RadD
MIPTLRPFQYKAHLEINQAWAEGCIDVGLNSATGTGKTVTAAYEMRNNVGGSAAIAHRQELVTQLSVALAANEVRHRIIGADSIKRNIVSLHMADGGRNQYDANARTAVAGVRTLLNLNPLDPIFTQSTKSIWDEGHHVLRENEWGRARVMFSHKDHKALHVSATWVRADGQGHGRHADGFIDRLINAPSMRDQINCGYLTPYKIITLQTSDLDLTSVKRSADGDFNKHQLSEAVHKSNRLVGDVVEHYLERAPGKLGVTFAVDVAAAIEIAAAFRARGVPAEVVSAKTLDHLRMDILRRFKRREILQLVNVDLFGEGFDLPAIEVVSFARPTDSWALYCQQFGRALRLMIDPVFAANWGSYTDAERIYYISISVKPYAIILDHVGNVLRHFGPPDIRATFDLDRRERRGSATGSDAIPYRVCANPNDPATGLPCAQPYERFYKCCPYCGYYPEPLLRSGPQYVDGKLYELDEATIKALWGNVLNLEAPAPIPGGMSGIIQASIRNKHGERVEAQRKLRTAMSWWSGLQDALGWPGEEEKQSRFYLMFGIDVLTAQSLNRVDSEKLHLKIYNVLQKYNIDGLVNMA